MKFFKIFSMGKRKLMETDSNKISMKSVTPKRNQIILKVLDNEVYIKIALIDATKKTYFARIEKNNGKNGIGCIISSFIRLLETFDIIDEHIKSETTNDEYVVTKNNNFIIFKIKLTDKNKVEIEKIGFGDKESEFLTLTYFEMMKILYLKKTIVNIDEQLQNPELDRADTVIKLKNNYDNGTIEYAILNSGITFESIFNDVESAYDDFLKRKKKRFNVSNFILNNILNALICVTIRKMIIDISNNDCIGCKDNNEKTPENHSCKIGIDWYILINKYFDCCIKKMKANIKQTRNDVNILYCQVKEILKYEMMDTIQKLDNDYIDEKTNMFKENVLTQKDLSMEDIIIKASCV